MIKVLFVCTENRVRSRAAEVMFMREPGLSVRSVGISETAVQWITQKDLEWADLVFVMERCHIHFIEECFPIFAKSKRLICLDIPDVYDYLAAELTEQLQRKLIPILEKATAPILL